MDLNDVSEAMCTRDFEKAWTLQSIPTEMLLHICSFLDSGFLIHRMKLVCRQFYTILANEQTWKIRQTKRWGANGVYPPIPVKDEIFPWSRACVKREEQIKLWGTDSANLRNVELRGHIACVDAVNLFEGGKYLASGSRDRSIVIWDVELASQAAGEVTEAGNVPVAPENAKLEIKAAAHKGWIWSLACNAAHLFSGSWDTTLRVWDRKSNFQMVTEFSTAAPCLCLSAIENLVACGTFGRKIFLFDTRLGNEAITCYITHKKSVLALEMDENRIISAGEDGKVVCYDMRAKKVVKHFKLPEPGGFPTCLSFRRQDPASWFYLGDNHGNLHLVDPTKFSIVKSYEIGHSKAIMSVFHSIGSVFTCSRDGNMKILEPSLGLNEIASYSMNEELPAVHSLYNIVAVAGAEGVVRLWSPRSGF